jgi:nicotinate-nucleotide adenylyltransferase
LFYLTAGDMTITDGNVPERLGVFGGTFDPPHNAHLLIATTARDELGLAEVVFMVAGDPWQKTSSATVTAAHHRLAMTELLVDGTSGLTVSDLEIRRQGPSYTADTLKQMAAPGVRMVLILGSDTLAAINSWHRPADVMALADIAVVRRRGNEPSDVQLAGAGGMMPPDSHIEQFEIPRLDISSSDIRRRFRLGQTVSGLVPDSVASYATHHGIYRDGP